MAPAVLLVCALFLAPLALTVAMSLFDWSLFGDRQFIVLGNYTRMLDDPILRQATVFTLTFAVATTAVTVVVGFGLAMFVSTERAGVGVIRTAVFLPVVVGMAAASFLWIWLLNPDVGPLTWILHSVGVPGSSAPLSSRTSALVFILVMTVWKSAGFAMLIFLIGLQAIPRDVQEAASVDGVGRWQRLRFITLPLLRPTIALVLTLQLTQNMLSFDQFFLMTKGGPGNSTITITYWVYNGGFVKYQLGYAAAIALVLLVALIVINSVQLRILSRSDDTQRSVPAR